MNSPRRWPPGRTPTDLGNGVKVGIIDTGIDFSHADFGGIGTAAAYNAASANPADPNWNSELPGLARTKIAGGYDFAGDAYTGGNTPTPDKDPLDCYSANGTSLGHGTHVAGILAGFGENADSSTFTGSYPALTSSSLNQMAIEPGSAPGATIYALKVYGCTGTSSLVMAALDWALDPNGDGNTTDHLDIVNLSLGADYAAEDDPQNTMIDKLASQGVLSVVAAGNAGDITLVGGSPGSATSALTVADSVGDVVSPDGAPDTLNSSSSRGTYGAVGTVKPDVAAPGTDIVSANKASGNGSVTLTGTSMATPLVAGIAALVKQTHPTWTPAQVKADVMDTAVHDVTTEADGGGFAYGPNRVGSGRVDAALATSNSLLAYDAAAPAAVSASFGVVDVPVSPTPNTAITKTRTVAISNNGTAPVTATVVYQASTTQSGVSYSLSPESVQVAAGATADVTITLTASANAIGRDMDPTMDPQQGGGTRDFTPLASGRLVITNSTTGSRLRVPVSAAVRLVSATTASANSPVSALTVAGAGFDTSGAIDGNGYHGSGSLLSVFTLGGSSPKKVACTATVTASCTQGSRDASGDLHYVGATSDYALKGANGSAYFAVNAWSEWTAPGTSTEPYVDIWTVSDPATEPPDFEAYVSPAYPWNDQDYFGIWLHDFATGSDDWVADLNGLDPRVRLHPVRHRHPGDSRPAGIVGSGQWHGGDLAGTSAVPGRYLLTARLWRRLRPRPDPCRYRHHCLRSDEAGNHRPQPVELPGRLEPEPLLARRGRSLGADHPGAGQRHRIDSGAAPGRSARQPGTGAHLRDEEHRAAQHHRNRGGRPETDSGEGDMVADAVQLHLPVAAQRRGHRRGHRIELHVDRS